MGKINAKKFEKVDVYIYICVDVRQFYLIKKKNRSDFNIFEQNKTATMTKYFYLKKDGNPSEETISYEDVKNKVRKNDFNEKTMIWYEGLDDWKNLIELDEFNELFIERVIPPPPPIGSNPNPETIKPKTKIEIELDVDKYIRIGKQYWKEAVIGVLLILFLIPKCGTNPSNIFGSGKPLSSELSHEQIVKKYLKVDLVNKGKWEAFGETKVYFKNTSSEYIFTLTKVGIQYRRVGGGISSTRGNVYITLQPGEYKTIEDVDIPFGVKPVKAYGYKDDIKIKRKQR